MFHGISALAIEMIIGLFVLGSLFSRQLEGLRNREFLLWAFLPLGFVAGILNMIVGVVARCWAF